eukprot:scaffold774_cov75-Cylindrotheca_fusiformis.AAC.10
MNENDTLISKSKEGDVVASTEEDTSNVYLALLSAPSKVWFGLIALVLTIATAEEVFDTNLFCIALVLTTIATTIATSRVLSEGNVFFGLIALVLPIASAVLALLVVDNDFLVAFVLTTIATLGVLLSKKGIHDVQVKIALSAVAVIVVALTVAAVVPVVEDLRYPAEEKSWWLESSNATLLMSREWNDGLEMRETLGMDWCPCPSEVVCATPEGYLCFDPEDPYPEVHHFDWAYEAGHCKKVFEFDLDLERKWWLDHSNSTLLMSQEWNNGLEMREALGMGWTPRANEVVCATPLGYLRYDPKDDVIHTPHGLLRYDPQVGDDYLRWSYNAGHCTEGLEIDIDLEQKWWLEHSNSTLLMSREWKDGVEMKKALDMDWTPHENVVVCATPLGYLRYDPVDDFLNWSYQAGDCKMVLKIDFTWVGMWKYGGRCGQEM